MMITQNLISRFTCSSLLILSLQYFFHTCNANCIPSACGVIRNISFPFRLKNDPKNCGDRKFEIVCENDVASIYANSQKYYVKEINYHYMAMRIADASINNSSCSVPTSSSVFDNFGLPYFPFHSYIFFTFMSCHNPLHNSSSFITQATDCEQGRHTYIKVEKKLALIDVEYMCTIDAVAATSWNFTDLKNVSLSEIHQSLLYGFNLSWSYYLCSKCKGYDCNVELNGIVTCGDHPSDWYYKWENFVDLVVEQQTSLFSVLLVIVVLFIAVISPPVMIIFAFVVVLGISLIIALYPWQSWSAYVSLNHGWSRSAYVRLNNAKPSLILIFCAPRFIILPLVVWFLIHKFRTRRLSSFEGIESFLQSDNKLKPIRYAYSDLKKMTRGFRDKLGEGGFGSVYKGKLQSGHHVAVKLLGKSGGNGQDFINEIATIGRIHHVNVVQLVGYCAERSKRALIFDFMPNGSLEKYLFNQEKMSSLNWETKFEIAVGIARGIEYLHRGCDIQILHFDIKPHNVLLDDKFIPKISDFGLAKFCSTEKNTVTMTAVRGTIGYVAPELINRSIGAVSYKADVYSFGMLLMEMVGLNRELKGNNDDSSKYFPCWIYDRFNQGREIEIEKAEESNGNSENESIRKSVVRKMTIVGLWCIQMNPDDRPSMNKVLQMLEGDVERLRIPAYPSQSTHVAVNVEESWGTSASDSVSLLHYNNSTSIEITIA